MLELLAAALWREDVGGCRARLRWPIRAHYAFGRIELSGPPRTPSGRELADPAGLIEACRGLAPDLDWDTLAVEVEDGVANQTLAYEHWAGLPRRAGSCTELALASGEPALFFEQLCVEGHNLHPGAKTRLGLSADEVRRYSPELEGRAEVTMASVRRELCRWAGPDDPNHFVRQLFPGVPIPEDRVFLPVHPFQRHRVLPQMFARELACGDLVLLDDLRLPCRATTSFRTVVPERRGVPTLKLPVHSQMTSTVRSMSANTVLNGPVYTELLRGLLGPSLVPVDELAGVHLADPDPTRVRNLGCIYREDLRGLVQPGEVPVVASSLPAPSPVSDKTVLHELAEAHPAGPRAFLEDYARALVPEHLRLMMEHGIALEAHLQNCVVVFREGRPQRVLVRDWGGLRLWRPRLGRSLAVDENSVTLASSLEELRGKLFYCLFQNHLGEVVLNLARDFDLPEASLWKVIHDVIRQVFPRPHEDLDALYAPLLPHKALLTMRLDDRGRDYHYVMLPNPLAPFRHELTAAA